MPDFLNRLAARALGALPLAEPLVSTRFDRGVKHVAMTPFESLEQSAGTSEAIDDRAVLRQAPVTPPESGFARFDPPSGDLDDATHLIRSQLRHVSRLQNLQRPITNEPAASKPDAQSVHPAVSALPLRSYTSEEKDAAPRVADVRRPSTLPLFAEPKAALINPVSEPGRVPGQQRQGMSASHHAPMVRVTIGRIEVRAELPARSPAPAPQRARSSHISLEQFLKQAGGGAR